MLPVSETAIKAAAGKKRLIPRKAGPALYAAGPEKGDHAAVWGVNSTDWVITYLALARLGVISVLVNISLTISELEVLVRENDIKYIIYSDGKMALSFLCFRKWKEIKRPV